MPQAAQKLLQHAKNDPALLTPDVKDWLKRVNEAAEKLNKVMRAVAQDQCVVCGNGTRIENKGNPVDRSAVAVAAVSEEFRALIGEGVRLARTISKTLNERIIAASVHEATTTGQPQAPKQILIGQTFYRCQKCSPGGKSILSIGLPPVSFVLPPDWPPV